MDLSEEPDHEFLVLASDGIWDHLSNDEAVRIAGRAIAQCGRADGGTTPSPAQSLIDAALTKVCEEKGLTRGELSAVPCGRQLRRYHDDMTALVLCLRSDIVDTGTGNVSGNCSSPGKVARLKLEKRGAEVDVGVADISGKRLKTTE